MPFIEMNLGGVSEPKPMPSGVYKVSIVAVEVTTAGQDSKPLIQVRVNLDDHPEAPTIRESLWLPRVGDTPEGASFKILRVKRFCHLFGLPYEDNGVNPEDWLGATATAQVRLTEPNDKGDQYNELVLPKIREDNPAAEAPKTSKRRSA